MSNPEPTRLRELENAFETAIRAMGQPLVDASAALHEFAELNPTEDEQAAEYDRLLCLGKITEGLGALCTPRLRLLAAILNEIIDLEQADEPEDDEPQDAGEKRHTTH
jgi:hypothetical protein